MVELSTLKLQNHSFIDNNYNATEADVVYTVMLGDRLAYFYLLCENQSDVDNAVPLRLVVYTVRLMEMHLKQYPNSPLPIVYPMVIYTGKKLWSAPMDIFVLFGAQEVLARGILFQPYQLIDVQRMSDDELSQRRWSGLVEFVLKHRRILNFAKFIEKLFPWLREVEIHNGSDFAKIVLRYVFDGVKADDENLFLQKCDEFLSTELRGEVMTLAQRFKEIGREQGLQQGMQQGECNILLRLLHHKFHDVPDIYQQRLVQADTETLLVWGERILEANTLQDVFED